MKILFIIQGEGRGHLTQALSLRQKLMAEGHEIVGVLVGKSPARRLPDFFLNKILSPVYPFESPNFLPTAKNKQVSLMRSVLYNVLRLHKYMGSIRYIDRMIRQTDADVVVNFYELLTGLTSPSESNDGMYRPSISILASGLRFPEAEHIVVGIATIFYEINGDRLRQKISLVFPEDARGAVGRNSRGSSFIKARSLGCGSLERQLFAWLFVE